MPSQEHRRLQARGAVPFTAPTGNDCPRGTDWESGTSCVLPHFSASLQEHTAGSGQWTMSTSDVSLLRQIYVSTSLCDLSAPFTFAVETRSLGWCDGETAGKSRLDAKEDARGAPGTQPTWQQNLKLLVAEVSVALPLQHNRSVLTEIVITKNSTQTRNQIQCYLGTHH